MAIRYVIGKHRSLELAERHAAALRRQFKAEVRITSRFNAQGKPSKRGQFFRFSINKKERKKKKAAWLVFFEYRAGNKPSSLIKIDFIVPGPPKGYSSDSVENATRLLQKTEESLPEKYQWIIRLVGKTGADSAIAEGEKAPKKIWIRSFQRGINTQTFANEKEFYEESESSE